jgi:hypothetical protein
MTVADKSVIAAPAVAVVAVTVKATWPGVVAVRVPIAVQLAPGVSDDVHVPPANTIVPSVSPLTCNDGMPAGWVVPL